MERSLTICKAVSGLLATIVVCQTGITLLLTYVANVTNTRRLGFVAFALCLVVGGAAGFLYRRKLSRQIIVVVLWFACFLSFIAYSLIGYYLLGWTGVMKP